MRDVLKATEEHLDPTRQTRYCIEASREHLLNQKKKQFLNKLSFEYSLKKINRQKLYGNMIEVAAQLYPKITYENNIFRAHQYSSASIRQNRRSYLQYKQIPIPQHQQSIKRYTHILSKKKQKGGIDSFWIFKKDANTNSQPHSGAKGRNTGLPSQRNQHQLVINAVEAAYTQILIFAKLPIDLQNGLVSKNVMKNYLGSIVGEAFGQWYVHFVQIKSYINLKQFESVGEQLGKMSLRQSHLISFQMYDNNGDGHICPKDVFSIFKKQLHSSIEQDIIAIAQFTKASAGRDEQLNQQYQIEHVIIRDQWLTIKDYQIFFKKIDEPYLRATNKKDTGFSKTFAVLDHRQKVRSTRRQLNQKKVMYNQLFGEIDKNRKNSYIDKDDYKLNFTFFHQVFPLSPTKLFLFLCNDIFGVNSVLQ